MAYETLLFTQEAHVAKITLNRPDKRNAMNGQMITELIHVLKETANHARTQVVLIQSVGPHFCAGADIHWMQHLAKASPADNLHDANQLATMLYLLHTSPKPTVVLAQGHTMGGGLGLLAAADIALCTEAAVFGFSEVTLGLAPSTISPYVVKAMGERLARYYFLTGERFHAKAAVEMQLVHACYENDDALSQAGHALAKTLAAYEPSALLAVKTILREVSQLPITPSLVELTAKHLAATRATPEAQAGLQAFFNRQNERGQR